MAASFDPQAFREVLGHYPTGVSVITAELPEGGVVAMVVGTFTSVSLDPPLVAFLPTRASSSFSELRRASQFAVNILAHDQEDLCRRLAKSDPEKMSRESWESSEGGLPVLDGVVAVIECDVSSVTEAGDHYIVMGAVTRLQTLRPTIPLLFFRGGYGGFAPSPALIAAEGKPLADAVARAGLLRDGLEPVATDLGGELTVFARVDDDDVAVATAAMPGAERVTALGTRHPLVPPLGVPLVAWSSPLDQEAWVDRAVGASEEERAQFRTHLDDARSYGWSLAVHESMNETEQEEADVRDFLPPARQSRLTRQIVRAARYQKIAEIEDEAVYRVSAVMAPVLHEPEGAPDLMLRLMYYPPLDLTGHEVKRRGAILRDFAGEAAATIRHGHAPAHSQP